MTGQPTPQGISALLRKAGHQKYTTISGYAVRVRKPGEILVEHYRDLSRSQDASELEEMLTAYQGVVEQAGFRVARDPHPGCIGIFVTAAEEEETDG